MKYISVLSFNPKGKIYRDNSVDMGLFYYKSKIESGKGLTPAVKSRYRIEDYSILAEEVMLLYNASEKDNDNTFNVDHFRANALYDYFINPEIRVADTAEGIILRNIAGKYGIKRIIRENKPSDMINTDKPELKAA